MAAACKHPNFQSEIKMSYVSIKSMGLVQLMARIVVKCSDCGAPFSWNIPGSGFSTTDATCSPDGSALWVPVSYPPPPVEETTSDEDEESGSGYLN